MIGIGIRNLLEQEHLLPVGNEHFGGRTCQTSSFRCSVLGIGDLVEQKSTLGRIHGQFGKGTWRKNDLLQAHTGRRFVNVFGRSWGRAGNLGEKNKSCLSHLYDWDWNLGLAGTRTYVGSGAWVVRDGHLGKKSPSLNYMVEAVLGVGYLEFKTW